MKFKSIIASVLAAACAACAFTARADHAASADDVGKEINVDGTLTVANGVTVDLNGGSLTYKGVTGFSGTGIFTGKAGSVLELEVTDDIAFAETATSPFTGSLKLVKSGSAKLTLPKNSTYTGGTEVKEGVLAANVGDSYSLSNISPFGSSGTIWIDENGTLDQKGLTKWKYSVSLCGGVIRNVQQRSTGYYDAKTVLEKSSTLSWEKNTYGVSAKFTLGGNTLSVVVGGTMNWKPTFNANDTGAIEVSGNGSFVVQDNISVSNIDLVEKMPINYGNCTMSVHDYTAQSATAPSGTGVLNVYGTFTPVSDYYFCPTMQTGTTINLSGRNKKWTSDFGINFVENAAVKIEIGDREVPDDGTLIEWNMAQEALNGRSFELVRNGEAVEDLSLVWNENGVAVKDTDTVMAFAEWTGAANDGDLANVTNWNCTTKSGKTLENLIPDGATTVKISYDKLGTFNYPVDATLAYTSIELTGEIPQTAVELAYDCDWRGLGELDFLFPIDLKGHKLSIALPSGDSPSENPGSVTSTGDTLGELNATVAAGQSYNNTNIVFSGNMKFVKDGAGTFVAAQYPQEYTGETVVDGGVLKSGITNVNTETGKSPFGATCTVRVEKNGILDPAGGQLWGYHTIEMNGGMISNTVQSYGFSSVQYNAASRQNQFNPKIKLLADSTFATDKHFNFQGEIIPNGRLLTTWIKSEMTLRWSPTKAENASIDVVGGGLLYTLKKYSFDEKTFSLKISNGGIALGGNLVISNYTAAASSGVFESKNSDATFKVFGTFTPETQNFVGCEMQNGSVIDLSEKSASWSTTGITWGLVGLKFANNAAVTIDVPGRKFTDGEQIVSWTEKTKPENLKGLTFELDEASKAAGYKIKTAEAGIFAWVDTGSEMTVEEIKGALPKGVVIGGERVDLANKTAAEIKEILNTEADNGLLVNENIILGIPQEEDGQFKKKPYLKADASTDVKEGMIKFAFGGINEPKTDKANVKFEIFTCGADGIWSTEAEVSGDLAKNDTPVADLPTVAEGQSAVKYFKVRFTVSEKAK